MSASPPPKRKCDGLREEEKKEPSDDLTGHSLITVPKFSELKEPVHMQKTVGGFTWFFVLSKESGGADREPGLGLEFHVTKNADLNVWFMKFSVCFTLIDQLNGRNLTMSVNTQYKSTDNPPRISDRIKAGMKWDTVLDANRGYVVDDTLQVDVEIVVKSHHADRFRKKLDYDFFTPNRKADRILVLEDKEFHVSSQLLSIQSQYFDSLFNEKYKEKEQEKITLEEVSPEDFENLLRLLYRCGDDVLNESNVEGVLKLADEWNVTTALDDVEKFLITSSSVGAGHKLQLADNYRLITLYAQAMDDLRKCSEIRDFKKSDRYGKCSEKTREDLFERYTELCVSHEKIHEHDLERARDGR